MLVHDPRGAIPNQILVAMAHAEQHGARCCAWAHSDLDTIQQVCDVLLHVFPALRRPGRSRGAGHITPALELYGMEEQHLLYVTRTGHHDICTFALAHGPREEDAVALTIAGFRLAPRDVDPEGKLWRWFDKD